MANRAGVEYDRLNVLWRRPGAKLNAEDLARIASYFETSRDWLQFGGDQPTPLDALREQAYEELSLLSEAELRALLIGIQARRVATQAGSD